MQCLLLKQSGRRGLDTENTIHKHNAHQSEIGLSK